MEGPESLDQLYNAIYFAVPPAVASSVGVRGWLRSGATRQGVGNDSGSGVHAEGSMFGWAASVFS